MKSNLECWKSMQEQGYFEKHVHFKNFTTIGHETIPAIEYFVRLESHYKVVVIGCGYGRETIQIAPLVSWVWGIDVNETILQKALDVLANEGIYNFTWVLAEDYEKYVPNNIDLVYSVVTMQHLTRDLVYDYFHVLSKKLNKEGVMIVQFLERIGDKGLDADLRVYEPSVTWKKEQIVDLAGKCNLSLEIRTVKIRDDIFHHWGCFRVKSNDSPK